MSTNDLTGAGQSQPGGSDSGTTQPQAPAAASQPTQDLGTALTSQPPVAGSAPAAATGSQAGAPTRPMSPYTSVPATPAGYSFTRPTSAAGSWNGGYGAGTPNASGTTPQYTYPSVSTPEPAPAETTGVPQAAASTPSPFLAASATSAPAAGGYQAASAGGYAATATAAESVYATAPYGGGAGGDGGDGETAFAHAQPSGRRRGRRRGPGWGGVIAATLAAALLASGGTAAVMHYAGSSGSPTASAPMSVATGSTTKTVSSTGTAPDWEAVTNAVANSVVSITVKTASGTAVGSGVIYDSEGHVVTNNHVVAGASQIQVTLADGRIYAAELTGTDPATDLAVIKLTDAPSDLTVAQFGDSDQVVTGQDVMAIGNPLGLSSTVTTGIVSAVNRPVVTTQEESDDSPTQSEGSSGLPEGLEQFLRPQTTTTSQTYTNAIQIDAAINPGNSGGPLFDETGKVIGITSSIAQVSESSGSIGLGFAIPGNLATKVANQLIESGKATHAYLGVSIGDGAAQVGDVTRAGAQVGSVESGSPAEKAGLKEGDLITAIDGKATSQAAALTGFVRQYSAGDTVTLTIVRAGQEQQVEATLAEREDS